MLSSSKVFNQRKRFAETATSAATGEEFHWASNCLKFDADLRNGKIKLGNMATGLYHPDPQSSPRPPETTFLHFREKADFTHPCTYGNLETQPVLTGLGSLKIRLAVQYGFATSTTTRPYPMSSCRLGCSLRRTATS
ncbi:hypothetical protein H4Q26_011026 [Puccinia striiformis f. sp. tritici PST-130]|nr:hypothetical protein H4Q26_011026 [Puccinia striiformis f. sp. tritici PST-130]